LHRRLGGFTGDTLGATQQLVELAMLLAALAALSR
jgi:adenosylcobinamide-GDP ribazoletransferase